MAHDLNDLVMVDPNADVLRGGFTKEQFYHKMFMSILLRKEPLETFVKYLDLYTPHIWSPDLQFYEKYLEKIESQFAAEYLPKLWTDLVACNFAGAPLEMKNQFMVKLGNVIKKLRDTGDDILDKNLGHIAEG